MPRGGRSARLKLRAGVVDPPQGAPGIVDVTSGSNTVSYTQAGHRHTVRGFTAVRGYDLASGVGTVNAASFVRELAAAAGH